MNEQLDVNDLVNGLLEQIGAQAKEIAILKAHLAAAQKVAPAKEGDDVDGDE